MKPLLLTEAISYLPFPSFSGGSCRFLLILRWDELDDSVKTEIAELLKLPRSLYGARPPLLNRVNQKTTLPDR